MKQYFLNSFKFKIIRWSINFTSFILHTQNNIVHSRQKTRAETYQFLIEKSFHSRNNGVRYESPLSIVPLFFSDATKTTTIVFNWTRITQGGIKEEAGPRGGVGGKSLITSSVNTARPETRTFNFQGGLGVKGGRGWGNRRARGGEGRGGTWRPGPAAAARAAPGRRRHYADKARPCPFPRSPFLSRFYCVQLPMRHRSHLIKIWCIIDKSSSRRLRDIIILSGSDKDPAMGFYLFYWWNVLSLCLYAIYIIAEEFLIPLKNRIFLLSRDDN